MFDGKSSSNPLTKTLTKTSIQNIFKVWQEVHVVCCIYVELSDWKLLFVRSNVSDGVWSLNVNWSFNELQIEMNFGSWNFDILWLHYFRLARWIAFSEGVTNDFTLNYFLVYRLMLITSSTLLVVTLVTVLAVVPEPNRETAINRGYNNWYYWSIIHTRKFDRAYLMILHVGGALLVTQYNDIVTHSLLPHITHSYLTANNSINTACNIMVLYRPHACMIMLIDDWLIDWKMRLISYSRPRN